MEVTSPNASENAIVSSDAMWAIDAYSVTSIDILEQDGIFHVVVDFVMGSDAVISADFEHCATLEDAEFKRAEILLRIETITGHI